ncbi:MAG: DUF364 domain-containing protein [Candidatus Omnitrophica bacterium]|nr:DUF364 domain-containing protein [Candidatus Omnitrophota bacterium]
MILSQTIKKIYKNLYDLKFLDQNIKICAKVLSPQEAIGNPEKYDFPLFKGKERIVEANFRGCLGHAFTDMHGGFEGSLKEILEMPSNNNYRRALQVATINALCRFLGETHNTVHCRDEEPQQCAEESVLLIKKEYPRVRKICFVGFQPAFVDAFSKQYDLKVLDLDQDNIGKVFFGQKILDGNKDLISSLDWADLVLATGSTVVNATIDSILEAKDKKKVIFYGVTIAGVAAMMQLNRLCFAKENKCCCF